MSRQLKELRSLMPWTWDARIEEHPAGESSLRDFKDVYRWTGDEKGRRSSAAPRDASAAPPPRNRVPKAERNSSGSGSALESTPRNKQAPSAAPEQTPNTRDSAASSGGHLRLPAATPGTGLRSSGRSGKPQALAMPAPDVITPAPRPQRPSSPPDSAISTGDRLHLQNASAPRRRTPADTTPIAGGSDAAVVASAAKASPACQSPEAVAGITAATIPSVSPAAQQAAQTDSPPKPFEAKLAAVEQAEGLPSPPPASPAHQHPQEIPQQDEQPEPLEHAADDETEETIAAATLLELPRPPSATVAPASAAQRQPMGELNSTGRRGAADADVGELVLQPKVRRKSGLLDAAWAAASIVKRPPQQKRSARQPTPATRIVSPRLLSQFPGRQLPGAPPAAEAQPVAQALPAEAAAAPTSPALVAQQQTAQPQAALPTVSAPPPALPELPPIAPLDLQPMRLQLAAEMPPLPASHGGGSSSLQRATARTVVQLAQQPASGQRAGASWAAAGPFTLRSPPAPLKRPGDPLDLAHACKLLKWMDNLERGDNRLT